jgi:hypothetical protein
MSDTLPAASTDDAKSEEGSFKVKFVINATFPAPPTRFEHSFPLTATMKYRCCVYVSTQFLGI